MKTVSEPTGLEKPKLQLNRPLVQIDEYASRLGVTRGVIEQADRLGIVHTRKFRGQVFVLDVPIPELSQTQQGEAGSEDLRQVVSRVLDEIEKKQADSSRHSDKSEGDQPEQAGKNRKKMFTGVYRGIRKFVGKIDFRATLKNIFRKKSGSGVSKPGEVKTDFELSGYPDEHKINDLQRLRVRDLLANSPVFGMVKSIATYGLLLVFTMSLLANLWVYTYSNSSQPSQSGNLSTASVNVEQLQSQYSSARQEISRLEERLAETKARNEQLQARIGSLQNRINKLTTELSITRGNLKQLKFRNKEALQRLESNY